MRNMLAALVATTVTACAAPPTGYSKVPAAPTAAKELLCAGEIDVHKDPDGTTVVKCLQNVRDGVGQLVPGSIAAPPSNTSTPARGRQRNYALILEHPPKNEHQAMREQALGVVKCEPNKTSDCNEVAFIRNTQIGDPDSLLNGLVAERLMIYKEDLTFYLTASVADLKFEKPDPNMDIKIIPTEISVAPEGTTIQATKVEVVVKKIPADAFTPSYKLVGTLKNGKPISFDLTIIFENPYDRDFELSQWFILAKKQFSKKPCYQSRAFLLNHLLRKVCFHYTVSMKKVLLIGNGAREHVIAETLQKFGATVFCYGKARNPGILQLAEDYETGSLEDFPHIQEYARKIQPDFAFIGPDDPIGNGVADLLLELKIRSVAPLKTVARLESSKSFTRALLKKFSIPGNPRFQVFYNLEGVEDFLRELGEHYVVKADGLMGGKGVKVSGDHLHSHAEALAFAKECLESGGRVVLEEKFVGQEFSLMSFVDGVHTVEMPAVQDHKRAFEGDKGPNTGGMGSYSDTNHLLPFLRSQDLDEAREITQRVAKALKEETGTHFQGIMYGGFIATANGVRLIEYNARFGDPEVLNVLPLLKTNFVEVCEAIMDGTLDQLKVEFENKATVCKYLVPEGYPDHPQKGQKITLGQVPAGVRTYYSSVDQTSEGLILSSSRAIAFVGIADSIAEAEELAESACHSVTGSVFYRKDIGTEKLIGQRVAMMNELRK